MNTFYFNPDGKCILQANAELDIDDLPAGIIGIHSELEASANEVYYDGEIKPVMNFSLVIATNQISNIPIGTTAIIGDSSEIVNDGILDLEVSYNSIVTVTLTHPHYYSETVEVSCEA